MRKSFATLSNSLFLASTVAACSGHINSDPALDLSPDAYKIVGGTANKINKVIVSGGGNTQTLNNPNGGQTSVLNAAGKAGNKDNAGEANIAGSLNLAGTNGFGIGGAEYAYPCFFVSSLIIDNSIPQPIPMPGIKITFSFTEIKTATVKVLIKDKNDKTLATLNGGENNPPDKYAIWWTGLGDNGYLTPGEYFYVLRAENGNCIQLSTPVAFTIN